jgi:2,3-dihydroxybenzoate-AMP ligase
MKIEGFTPYPEDEARKYEENRWWLGITLGDMLQRAADFYPNKEALVEGETRMDYGTLRKQVNQFALGLVRQGVKKGDRVLVQLPNWYEFVIAYFAIHTMGGIVVLLNSRNTQFEIDHLCRVTDAEAWIVPDRYRKIDYLPIVEEVKKTNPSMKHVILVRREKGSSAGYPSFQDVLNKGTLAPNDLEELRRYRPDPCDVAQILPSGGTTGLSKAAPRTHNDYISNVEGHARAWELNSQDVCLIPTPVGHNLALLAGITSTVLTFGKIVLVDSTVPEDFCRTIEQEKVTCATFVPALVGRLVSYERLKEYDLRSLVKIYAGGANSPPDLVRATYEKIGCQYVNTFGMVEGPCSMTRLNDPFDVICNTVGRPCCPYEEFRVVDADGKKLPLHAEGELAAKGPGIFTGYLKSEEENKKIFTRDGFLKTGDLAVINESGYIKITGRIKDIIIRGGENISARDVEDLIASYTGVEYVAVVGMPDPLLGEKVCAYVKMAEGHQRHFEKIIQHLKGRGASVLLLPERIEFVDEIPLTKAGKPDKKVLRSDIQEKLKKEGTI